MQDEVCCFCVGSNPIDPFHSSNCLFRVAAYSNSSQNDHVRTVILQHGRLEYTICIAGLGHVSVMVDSIGYGLGKVAKKCIEGKILVRINSASAPYASKVQHCHSKTTADVFLIAY